MSLVSVLGCGTWFFPIEEQLYCFDSLVEPRHVTGNPGKPSHMVRRGRPLPQALSQAHGQHLFAPIHHPMDKALVLLMLRCGLRVSEVVHLTMDAIDWSQPAIRIEQGQGRQDRRVYVSPDAVTSLQTCLALRPAHVPGTAVFWNPKRPHRPLSITAVQKKMERYAKAAGIKARCHGLRHTVASNFLEHGTAIVTSKAFLGPASIASSERSARVSNQKVKQEYLRSRQKILHPSKVEGRNAPVKYFIPQEIFMWYNRKSDPSLTRRTVCPQRSAVW